MAAVDLKSARAAKRRLAREIADEPDVNGIGLAPVDGMWALKVNLLTPAHLSAIPGQVDGVDVKVEVTGRGMRELLA